MTRFTATCLALLLSACGSASDPGAATPDATTVDTMAGDATAAEVVTPTGCEPGDRVCVDDATWTSCTEEGELGEPVTCAAETTCVAGHCRTSLCTPGEVRCASWTARRTCEANGARWAAAEYCGVDEICHDGQCLTCFPGEPTCATLVATTVCGDDGLSFPMDDIASCSDGDLCHEPTGLCLAPECSPEEATCAGALGSHVCLASGTRFSPEITPCAPGETCANAACSPAGCPPHPVLFLVDRTGAVGIDWDAFRSAIKAATADHPHALYGFMPFPMAFGCPAPGAGELPRFPAEANADVDAWFDTVPKSAGEAALQHVLQTILDRAHEVFGGNGGRVVLISSGDAECESDTVAIGAIVAALRLDHAVRTFVIGHRASAGFYPALDAAHAQGGSGWDDWEETSYDLDLTQALITALEDVPPCD